MSQGLVERQNLEDIADAIRSKNGSSDTYTPAEMAQAISGIHTADEVVLVQKTVNSNGQYNASDDSVDGYSGVRVNVPNSYSASDEGKVVSNGALVAQTSKQITQNGTHDTTANNSVVVDVPNSYAAADEGKVVSGGALVGQTSRDVTANGTYDTTENNQVVVNVPGGGGGVTVYKENVIPDASIGNDGDIWIYKTKKIISNGNQDVNTGIDANSVYGFEFTFEPLQLKEPYQSYLSSVQDHFTIGAFNSLTSIFIRARGNERARPNISGKTKVSLINGVLSLNDVTITTITQGEPLATTSQMIHIFANANGDRKSVMGFHNLVLYDNNGNKMIDLVPSNDGNNIPCLFDKISNDYFYSSGSVDFTMDKSNTVYEKINGIWEQIA